MVGLALIALAVYLAVGALRALATQSHPETSTASLVLLLASAVVLPPLALGKYRVAARLASGALRADSILTAVAALLAVISLASLAASQAFGLWWADAIAALVVAAIVIREGWSSVSRRPGTRPSRDGSPRSDEAARYTRPAMSHVFVAPHPDDVALSCGGLIAGLRELGQHVTILTVFSGTGRPRTATHDA